MRRAYAGQFGERCPRHVLDLAVLPSEADCIAIRQDCPDVRNRNNRWPVRPFVQSYFFVRGVHVGDLEN